MRPTVRYAAIDQVSIAYQVVGQGPPDLVFSPGFVSHLDLAWEEPYLARFLRRLASFSRLIWYDKRGTGLSGPIGDELPPDARVEDIRAVLDAAGSRQAVVFGVSEGAALSALFAHRHPERVASLVLYAGYAAGLRDAEQPWAWSGEFFERFLGSFERTWETGHGVEVVNPSLADDGAYRAWLQRYLRAAASPDMARRMMRANAALDLRSVLPELRVPTLVLHRADDAWMPADYSRFLASLVPGARLVELPGRDHWPWVGDSEAVLGAVEHFVTGRPPRRARRPATGPEAMTHRELEVARLAASGLSAPEIGRRLGIGERTVETHIASVYAKLGVASRLDLVRRAREFGL